MMRSSPPKSKCMSLKMSRKRSDESVNEHVDRICQLAHHAQLGNGSNATIEFEVQCRLIQAILDADIELWKELLKVSHEKKYHIYWRLVAHTMPLSVEWL